MRGPSRPLATILALLLAVGSALVIGACGGESDEHDVVEGEAAEIGDLSYHVQFTRFLNPNDGEDAEYLAGQPEPPAGEGYLGVFLRIENESDDEDLRSADDYSIVDIRGSRYEPLESESPFALEIGGIVPADSQLPISDSPAASGVAAGGVLIFLVEDAVVDSRPLMLEIEDDDESASVQLDM
ncbi:MAG TPA: hypothetical protein VK919_07090 [Solirubrobacterales bacterium]|nr:hypothetical protein [Solirubrobacterales bacterium]